MARKKSMIKSTYREIVCGALFSEGLNKWVETVCWFSKSNRRQTVFSFYM
jgi:hypothetical protein